MYGLDTRIITPDRFRRPGISDKIQLFSMGRALLLPRVCALSLAVLSLATLACGTRHATLDFTAPSTATADTPFTVTVTVMIGSERDTIINNRIHFASSDPAAVLPDEYYF